jgi:hypothetical protein
MYIALIFHSPCKYCKYFKCHSAWEDHLIFDDRHLCLNKVHYHYLKSPPTNYYNLFPIQLIIFPEICVCDAV